VDVHLKFKLLPETLWVNYLLWKWVFLIWKWVFLIGKWVVSLWKWVSSDKNWFIEKKYSHLLTLTVDFTNLCK
jgi:hypothetical protein